ncbi:hypothetical protein GCM10011342_29810 [Aquisalinus flavus]|uniref:Uncharacterized protein n=1 Tax=Aquisalinus flavus TaxID=1526572 RepID=A0A8J2Y4F5_9PROT|nr:hypothetical protein GCM10011342_29810 [Aquisalinus flavus]
MGFGKTVSRAVSAVVAGASLAVLPVSNASAQDGAGWSPSCESWSPGWDMCEVEVYNELTGEWETQVFFIPTGGETPPPDSLV